MIPIFDLKEPVSGSREEMSMRADIAKRLYEYRTASGLSQEQVANEIGVSRQAVSKWECGESSPDTDNLIALAVLYGVTVDELLFADPESREDLQDGADASKQADCSGDDYVNISLENGVHVKDSKTGEEVHVGWDGIHIDNDKEHVHIDFSSFMKAIKEFRREQQ